MRKSAISQITIKESVSKPSISACESQGNCSFATWIYALIWKLIKISEKQVSDLHRNSGLHEGST